MMRMSCGFASCSWSGTAGARLGIGMSSVGMAGSAAAVIGTFSLPAEDEAIDAALDAALDELVARGLGPGREVLRRACVGGEHLEELSADEPLDGLCCLDDRHRARQALCIDPLCDLERHS